MKTLSPLLALFHILLATHTLASDYLGEFERLKESGNAAEIQAFLTKSANKEQENPDYYATAGNYWWQVSQSVSITTKRSEGGDFSVRDQKSGKEVGSISTAGQTNPEIPKKALEILSEGVRRFPERADIALGLAHVQQKMGSQSECVQTLINLLAFSRKDPESLRWKKNDQLPTEANQFIPEAIQGYSAGLYQSESAESDALCARLCDATIEAFPDHPFAYNIKAALASAAGKQDEALGLLKTAHLKAPDDPLILLNLGDAYMKANHHTKAKESYGAVLKLKEIDDSLKEQARDAIQNVEQEAGTGQPATRPESKSKGSDKPQPESEGRSR
jgi:tetratricopeptide (TPR) repeat protein